MEGCQKLQIKEVIISGRLEDHLTWKSNGKQQKATLSFI